VCFVKGEAGHLDAVVDPSDRRYVEGLPPGPERDTVVASLARHRAPEALEPGDALPAVTLRRADDLEAIDLVSLVRGRPLLIVFGSFTWPPFRRRSGDVESLYCRFRDRADFAFVYIAEAHAADEWQMPANLDDDAVLIQQSTLAERRATALESADRLSLSMPLFLDEMDDHVSKAFAAWPERLVLVGGDGRIAYPGSPGPFGFSPESAEEQLVSLLAGPG
jgi:hypothetical protein